MMDDVEEEEETAGSGLMSLTEIQQAGFRFEYTETYRLIGRCSRASITQAWRLAATLKEEELLLRSETDQSTYLHHIVNQVHHLVPGMRGGGVLCVIRCALILTLGPVSTPLGK